VVRFPGRAGYLSRTSEPPLGPLGPLGGRIVGLMPRSVGGVTLPPPSCLPGVHGNDLAYPSCYDRVYRVCPQILQAKEKDVSSEVMLRPCPCTSHPFHRYAVIRCDVMWLNNCRYTIEWAHSAVFKARSCLSVVGAFANCEKRLLASCPSIRPSVCPHGTTHSPSTVWIFMKVEIWGFFFPKICWENSSFIKSNNNGHITRRPMYIYHHISPNCSYNEKCFDVGKVITYSVFIFFFRKSCRL